MAFPVPPHVGRLRVESRHRPAMQGPGGDVYDVSDTAFGVRLLIADVMGSGPVASQIGLAILEIWRELACCEPRLADIAVRLHAHILRSEYPERFVTALLMTFPAEGAGQAELVCCGHPPPLLLRDGRAAFAELTAAPPLGLLDLVSGWCQAVTFALAEGDRLLLYTDGLSEARDAAGHFFPLAARAAALADSAALADGAALANGDGDGGQLLDALLAGLREHAGARARDDILVVLASVQLPVTGYLEFGLVVQALLSAARRHRPGRA